ncbi:uncharacterized protein LOC119683125 [Teleopsis dalmanni]|uniref:uncharacterized protein LOC119683125 n=1 Tax=Teleopsis dalmanni TaxID=139649 RepID=UPI000D329E1D|nr:uncharacterized protein LOC119683125 [Teleopsis dalmanni]XP_037952665.1 uncharacterized protein LOC119683125 [Teleopsis dalmanni]XP_037952667.1 uncharacterized protein LOC119683125 [Teleopsis dalmanni]
MLRLNEYNVTLEQMSEDLILQALKGQTRLIFVVMTMLLIGLIMYYIDYNNCDNETDDGEPEQQEVTINIYASEANLQSVVVKADGVTKKINGFAIPANIKNDSTKFASVGTQKSIITAQLDPEIVSQYGENYTTLDACKSAQESCFLNPVDSKTLIMKHLSKSSETNPIKPDILNMID